ncbi:hypothetical protein [Micromonospora sp. CPCC 206061]|uniref:hypothetical protein n=1 Tax=Micromonospora sp. CPCC 206061 TaxID=3122410 RepID=UPI002FF18508
MALDASRINISHGMRAPHAEVDGAVILEAARIGDTLELIDTRLLESSSTLATLNARRLLVDGDLRIADLSATGSRFDLSQARVTGHSVIGPLNPEVPLPSTELMTLHLDSCQLDSLDLVDVLAEIDLEGTTVRRLYVHTDSPMRLSGLSYQDLAIGPTGDLREALAWLARDPAFIPQTYEQLAAFYSGQGREADAREVRLGARRLARAREPWLRRLPGLLSDSVAGYGYRPSRAFVWLLIFWLMMLGWDGRKVGTKRRCQRAPIRARAGRRVSTDHPSHRSSQPRLHTQLGDH